MRYLITPILLNQPRGVLVSASKKDIEQFKEEFNDNHDDLKVSVVQLVDFKEEE